MGFVPDLCRKRGYNTIKPSQLETILNNDAVLILDVRNPGEYRKGHIPNAVNIPVNDIPARLGELSAYKKQPIIVYCSLGGRSSKAAEFLSKNGYKTVYNLKGGISSYKGKLTRK